MGFWALFGFALKWLYVVAWPCLALGYPLCASIRAIETKSDYHTRKLVTYWILFSLISLFEHAFSMLLQRLPVWPHTKLAVVCWLVTRHFNGAVCVYKLVVCPCLSVDRETVINWLSRQKDSLRKGATALAVVGKYVRDNKTEALEKLLASKSTSTHAKPCCVVDGSKSAAAEAEKMKASKPCVSEESEAAAEDGDGVNASIAKRILASVEVKRTTGSTGSSWEHPQIPAFFRETPTCQVRKDLDTTLNPQLEGREHQPADEELKEKSQASKSELLHASTPKSTSIPKAKREEGSSLTVCSHEVDNHKANNSDPPNDSVSDNGDSFNTIAGEEEKLQVTQFLPYDNLNNNCVVEFKQSKWWCKICNISCTSQGNMDCHLSGSKHLCTVQKILAPEEIKETTGATGSSWEDPQIPAFFRKSPTNDMTTEPDTSMGSHFQGMEHQAADEVLKAKSGASKSKLPHASTPKNSNVPKAENEKGASVSLCSDKVDSHDANNSHPPKEELKKSQLRKDEQEKSVSSDGDSFNTITKGEKLQFTQVFPHDNLNNNWFVEFKQFKWWCKICNISCSSQGNMDAHLKGSKHLCRAQKIIAVCGQSIWRCTICNISCSSGVDMDSHLNGKKHLARAEEVDSPDILKTQTVVEFKESKWWCSICNIRCGCQGTMDCHLKGKKHLSCARSMVVVFDPTEWRCTICNISTTNGEKMDCHLKGKKHLSAARVI